ncbi:MAG: hypothetical protein ACKOEH_05430, partial [Actinomycetota bacterium]
GAPVLGEGDVRDFCRSAGERNLSVALLVLPAIINLNDNDSARLAIAGVSLAILVAAILFSRRKTVSMTAA